MIKLFKTNTVQLTEAGELVYSLIEPLVMSVFANKDIDVNRDELASMMHYIVSEVHSKMKNKEK